MDNIVIIEKKGRQRKGGFNMAQATNLKRDVLVMNLEQELEN